MDDVIERLRAADERTSPPHVFDLDDGLRRVRARVRRRHAVQGSVAAGMVAAAAVVVASMWWPGGPVDSATADDPDPGELLEVLAGPQEPADELPIGYVEGAAWSGANDIVESSSRLVAEDRHVDYWAALDEAGNICLVLDIPEHGTGARDCRSPAAFAAEGVTAGVTGQDGDVSRKEHAEAWLLPDGYDVEAVPSDRWALLLPNLATRVPDVEPAGALSALREPQRPEDRMPTLPDGREMTGSIVDSTSRLMYEAEDLQVWAGQRAPEESGGPSGICVVVYLSHDSWGTGTSCGSSGVIADEGLEILIESGGRRVEAWLLPDGFDFTADEAQEWTQVAPNLAIREPD